jgi:hypothetical protein
MPKILASQEEEIRRIIVQSQPQASNEKELGGVAQARVPA